VGVRSSTIKRASLLSAMMLAVSGGTILVPPAEGQDSHMHQRPAASGAPATIEQQANAARLFEEVKAGVARFARVDAALAEGYQGKAFRFGDWGPSHFRNRAFARDGAVLNAARPEGLVYLKLQDGRTVLLGAFFIAPRGQGPQPGGPITEWHHHNEQGSTEMMHVWTFGHPDGPFGRSLTREALRAAIQFAAASR